MLPVLVAALLAAQPAAKQPAPGGRPAVDSRKETGPGAGPGPAAGAKDEPSREEPALVDDDGVELAGAHAGAVRVPSSPGAWGGPRTPDQETLSDRVADYDLQATLDPATHELHGSELVRWRNRSDRPIRHLYFHLYPNAFEGYGSTFLTEWRNYGGFRTGLAPKKGEFGWLELRSSTQRGRPVAWKFVHPDGGPEVDRTVVRLDLPEAVPPGGTTELALAFDERLPRVIARSGWFGSYHLVAQWFPKVGVLELPGERGATRPRWNCHEYHLFSEFYADFGSYRAAITLPAGFTFGSTGVETEPPETTPAGVVHRAEQDDVHDFAFTAWDGFATPLLGTWTGPGSPRVTVKVLTPREYPRAGRIALRSTIDALDWFSKTLGPYPYPQVTVVVPPFNADESAGMEYETFFTTVGSRREPLLSLVRPVTIHEFGHGYFMGLLATNEFEEPFLDEGLNELWDARMQRDERSSFTHPLLAPFGLRTPPLSPFDLARSGTQRFQSDPIAGNSWDRYSTGSYGLVYARTALVFHDLEERLGGDVLARGFAAYYARWHHRHPSTADFEQSLAEAAGPAGAPLVHEWFARQVYEAAPVDDELVLVEAREVAPLPGTRLAGGRREELDEDAAERAAEEQRAAFRRAHPGAKGGPFLYRSMVQARRKAFQVPQELRVRFEDGAEQRIAWPAGERWHRWVFTRAAKVASAQLDPDRKVLLDLDKLDDGRTREPDGRASRRWTLEFASWLGLAVGLLEGL